MIFRAESDVRKWLRDNGGRQRFFWIEHGIGGTVGNLDCLAAIDEELIPIECKKGSWSKDGKELQIKWRTGQKQVIQRLYDCEIKSWLLVGEINSKRLWLKLGINAVREVGEWKTIESWEGLIKGIS